MANNAQPKALYVGQVVGVEPQELSGFNNPSYLLDLSNSLTRWFNRWAESEMGEGIGATAVQNEFNNFADLQGFLASQLRECIEKGGQAR